MELNELTRERLTDDWTYKEVKDVAEGLTRAGRLPACDLLRYIKLAEYETREKDMNDEIEQAFRQGYSKGYEKAAKTISMLYEVERLEDKHWNECRQIALYQNELSQALDLLSECYGALNALGKLAPNLPRDVQDYVEGLCVRIDSLREESARTTEVPADE